MMPLFFANAAYGKALTWDDCVKIASQSNPSLKAAAEGLHAAENTTKSSRNGYFPQVAGSVSYSYSSSPTLSYSASKSWSDQLTVSQNVFNGFSDVAKVDSSKAAEGVSAANLITVKAQVSYNLKNAFEGVVYAKDAIRLAQQITARRDVNLRLVQLRFQNGHENKGSVLLYQAYLRDSKFNELQNQDALTTAKVQLAQALGMDDFDELDVSGNIPVQEPGKGSVDLLHLAQQTPSYLTALNQEKSADAALLSAKSGFFPTLALNGSVGDAGPALTWSEGSRTWAGGATLSIPLFNGGRDYFATKAASDNLTSAQVTLYDTGHQAMVSLQEARITYIESVEQVGVNQDYLNAAEVRAEIARADYKNGLMSFQDWDLAETDLITRQKTLLSSQQARVVAEAAWEQAQGKGVIP
jgi:outer membrane protein TolC